MIALFAFRLLTSKTCITIAGLLLFLNFIFLVGCGGIANDKDKVWLIIQDLKNRGLIDNLPSEIPSSVRPEIKFWQEEQHPKAVSAQLKKYIAELDSEAIQLARWHAYFLSLFLVSFVLKILRICISIARRWSNFGVNNSVKKFWMIQNYID